MGNINKEKNNVNNKNKKNESVKTEDLSSRSEKDKVWDVHRKNVDLVADLYNQSAEFERYFQRMDDCSGRLEFSQILQKDTGELKLKLSNAHFCRVRHCPICQWRKSLMWKAKFYKAIPEIMADYKSARWLFLTLTVKNCDVKDLKSTIQKMNKAFKKIINREHFKKYNLGFVKTTEITRSKDGTAHPHFHILLLMNSSYFRRGYMKQEEWRDLWVDVMDIDYIPQVDIRTVKIKLGSEQESLSNAVAETLKYAVKPSDMIQDREWFLEMNRQVFKMRFVSTGGILKDLFKDETTEKELLLLNEEENEEEKDLNNNLFFNWYKTDKKYKRKLAD
ncbi:MAG: protein rep [Lactococcus cremoris]|uniref:protein rep n=1 Tax=Escherichia coli TaxID=562 RepID=UPI00330CCA20|nr:protein rep [Shigella flexneri]